jgi:dephospho-CoA kinase
MIIFPQIIAICGKKRSGKDMISNYISSKYNYTNKKISEDLKAIIKILFNFNDSQIETDEKDVIDPLWGIKPRQSMQFLGTEIMQFKIQELLPKVQRKFWITSFINKNIINNQQKIIISDLRFLHEFEELKKFNAFIIRVERNQNNSSSCDEHISEKEYLQIPTDIVIQNDGTIKDLYNKINELPQFRLIKSKMN